MLSAKQWTKAAMVVAFVVGTAGDALARGGRRQTGGYETVELSMIRSNPKAFIGKRISFDCFFAGLGRIYQPFQTPFVAEQYLNFNVWEPQTKLWDNGERRNAFLFCFIPRDLEKETNYVMRKSMYQALRLFGRVTVVYAGHPWFEVDDVEPSSMPSMTETALKHIMVGLKSVRNGQFDMAEKSFDLAIKEHLPTDAKNFAQRELGSTYYELGKYAEAADTFSKAAVDTAEDPWVLLRWGQSLSRASDGKAVRPKIRTVMLREALTHLDTASKRDPANPDVHAEIGWVKAKLGEPLVGIKHVKEALALDAGAPSYRILGRIYVQIGRLDDGDDAYNNAIVRDPTNPLYHREVADLIYMPQGRYAIAEREYANLTVELAKTDPDGYLKLAAALLKQGKVDEAKVQYGAALRQDKDNIKALLGRAAIYRDEADYVKAGADLDQAATLAPKNPDVLVARIQVLQAKGDYDRAVEACHDIIRKKLTRDLAPVYYTLGVSHFRKQKPDLRQAAAQLGLAVRADPNNADYRKALSDVLIEMGQFQRAVVELQRLKTGRDERTRLLLVHAKVESGDYRGAKGELEKLLKDMPDSVWAKNYLAFVIAEYDRQPDLERALQLAQAANAKEATNPVFQDTLAWVKFKLGKPDEARILLDMAVIEGKGPEAFYHLAVVSKETEPDVARDSVEEALRKLHAMTGRGVATNRLLQNALGLARQVDANPRPGPKE